MHYLTCSLTDKGDTRKINQDSMLLTSLETEHRRCLLASVCDGMGGLAEGEKASGMAVKALEDWFHTSFPSFIGKDGVIYRDTLYAGLRDIAYEIDRAIRNYEKTAGVVCGTTMTLILTLGDRFVTMNIGDSRVYVIRDGRLHHLTKDQTYVQVKYEEGEDLYELEHGKMRSYLIQCLGAGDVPRPVFSSGTIKKGDLYLLCSDGFRHEISDDEIAIACTPGRIRSEDDMEHIGTDLIQMNRRRGEKDNITLIMVQTR